MTTAMNETSYNLRVASEKTVDSLRVTLAAAEADYWKAHETVAGPFSKSTDQIEAMVRLGNQAQLVEAIRHALTIANKVQTAR